MINHISRFPVGGAVFRSPMLRVAAYPFVVLLLLAFVAPLQAAVESFKPGDVVEFSAYVMSTAKLGAGSLPRISLGFADANWKSPTEVSVAFPCEPSAEWKQVSGKVTVPAGFKSDWHVKCMVVVWLETKPEKAGAIYVDDVQAVVLPAAVPAK